MEKELKIDLSGVTFLNGELRQEMELAMAKFEINTPLRAAHFLAQCKHESANFSRLVENLNYSAQGLRTTFPKYFPDIDVALHYERKPEKIANRVYASRMGNGDETSGDGWKFRGRGYIQLTGKDNYTAFGKAIEQDITDVPDLIMLAKYASLSAAWFFKRAGCNTLADQVGEDPTKAVQDVTKKINGGLHGITDRIENFKKILPLIKIA